VATGLIVELVFADKQVAGTAQENGAAHDRSVSRCFWLAVKKTMLSQNRLHDPRHRHAALDATPPAGRASTDLRPERRAFSRCDAEADRAGAAHPAAAPYPTPRGGRGRAGAGEQTGRHGARRPPRRWRSET